MADPRRRMLSGPFLVINGRHHDITAIVKGYLYVSQLLGFFNPLLFKYLSFNVYLEGNLGSAHKFNNVTS